MSLSFAITQFADSTSLFCILMIFANIVFFWLWKYWLYLISLSCTTILFAGFTPFFFMPMIFSDIIFIWLRRYWFIIKYIGHNNRKEYFHCLHLSLVDWRNHKLFTLTTIWSVYPNIVSEIIILLMISESNLKCSSYWSPLVCLAIAAFEL